MLNTPYKSQSSAIASYSYTDIADGTGLRLFYGCYSSQGYFLTQNQIGSETTGGLVPELSSTYPTPCDQDFDLSPFNAPVIIRGIAICQIGYDANPPGHNNSGNVQIKIRKWDGTTETEIASATSASKNSFGNFVLLITIPKTPFKKGETLRITLIGNGENVDTKIIYFGVDPLNRDGTITKPSTNANQSTQLKFWIPFDLDL